VPSADGTTTSPSMMAAPAFKLSCDHFASPWFPILQEQATLASPQAYENKGSKRRFAANSGKSPRSILRLHRMRRSFSPTAAAAVEKATR